ncbi:hypothetical protein INR49_024026 [Caranx melampygus]|nr:hypothetical protein INR49_024026 [Caranx melampygus]
MLKCQSTDSLHPALPVTRVDNTDTAQVQTAALCNNFKLSSVPSGLPHNIEELQLNYNHVATLLQNLTSLEYLNLSGNILLRLDETSFRDLHQLKELDLQRNIIFELDGASRTRALRLPLELRSSLNPPDAAELLRPADTLGREADTGMVGTEMLAPPDTADWLLFVKDEGKLLTLRATGRGEEEGEWECLEFGSSLTNRFSRWASNSVFSAWPSFSSVN